MLINASHMRVPRFGKVASKLETVDVAKVENSTGKDSQSSESFRDSLCIEHKACVSLVLRSKNSAPGFFATLIDVN